jgi:colanic acid/amylovoran biosynthesis protein
VKKFLLIGGYSHANPGDEAILKATVYRLNELFPGAFFHVWASRRDFRLSFDRPIAHQIVRWSPLGAFDAKSFLSRASLKLYTDTYPVSAALVRAFSGVDRKFEKALADSEAVIYVGGGYLNSNYLVAEMEYLCALAVGRGKRIFLLGQTLGPFTKKKHAQMARSIFRGAEAIVIRDRHSAIEVSKWPSKVIVGVDDAVGFAPFLDAEDRAEIDEPIGIVAPGTLRIGLNLRSWENSREYYPAIARAIGGFITGLPMPARVVFLPMETSVHCDDRAEAAEFAKYLPSSVDFKILDREVSTEAKLRLAGRMDLFLGMRLHSLVFALTSGVPTVGLYNDEYYLRKIGGVFEAFGVPDFALPLDEAPEKLRPLLERALADSKAVSEMLRSRQKEIVSEKRAVLTQLLNGRHDSSTNAVPQLSLKSLHLSPVPMKG